MVTVLDIRVPLAFRDEGQLTLDGFSLPTARRAAPNVPERRPLCAGAVPAGAAGRTLDDVLSGVWRELAVGRDAPCPVCAATMAPSGRCGGCGSTLT